MNKFFQALVNYTLQQVLIFGIVAGLAYYFLLFDDGGTIQSSIQGIQAQIQQEEVRKKDTEATLKEAQRMKDAVVQLSRQYQEISRRIPSNLTSIELNRNIDAFARNSGVSIKSRKPLAIVSKEIVDEVPVQITLEGGYSDLAQFLYLVSSAERVTSIKTFLMRPVERQASRVRFEGTVIGYQLADETKQNKNAPKKPGGR